MTFADPASLDGNALPATRAATSSSPAGRQPASLSSHRWTAVLLLAQFMCMWGAFFVLAPSIDWPASLDLPASVMLPLLIDKSGFVFCGYTLYLVHALLLLPLAVALSKELPMGASMSRSVLVFGVLAGVAKVFGIVRWLFLMPILANAWVAPETGEATRAAVAVTFDAFNAYAGGIGEWLGVGLFSGIWTVLLSAVLLAQSGSARWLGITGFVAALLLFTTLPSLVGIESPLLLTLSGIIWQFWMAALAVWFLCTYRQDDEAGR